MPNRLSQESSPYLLQHQNNPVDWYPWCEEALEMARERDRPIFLSIGYAACHWCHVMEHESFENERIAAFLNEHFVSIKVDREERPDLDQIYMQAVMALKGGGGGWPLSAFLLPNCEVFYGGTYWPPTSRPGMPGFDYVLDKVLEAYKERRGEVELQANQVTAHLESMGESQKQEDFDFDTALQKTMDYLTRSFDPTWGGFGAAPKFPHTMDLNLLIDLSRAPHVKTDKPEILREMVNRSLMKMAQGGIYDHVGGGFARYSVDEQWLVPHFEKMLYDNGLLLECYADAYRHDPIQHYRDICEQTIEYLCRDMKHEQGAFFSSEDADSEGEEGTYYVWSESELKSILSNDDFSFAQLAFGITQSGNFEGRNILHLPFTDEVLAEKTGFDPKMCRQQRQKIYQQLFSHRERRVRPGCDDKVIVSWNALMISGLCKSSWVLDQQHALDAAVSCATFIEECMRTDSGRLHHTWRNGKPSLNGFLDDYANLIVAYCDLYFASFDETWVERADELASDMVKHFADQENGGFYFTPDDHEKLITRNKDYQDSSVPSGNSMAACGLLTLGRLTGNDQWTNLAVQTIQSAAGMLERAPMAAAQMLHAVLMWRMPTTELIFVGSDPAKDLENVRKWKREFLISNSIVLYREANRNTKSQKLDSWFDGRNNDQGNLGLYLCHQNTCQLPVSGDENIDRTLANFSKQLIP